MDAKKTAEDEERWRVTLLWEDWVKALGELSRADNLSTPELKNPFFIFIHGCEAIVHGGEVKSRLGTTLTKMENLRPRIMQRPRFLERAVDVLLAAIKQPVASDGSAGAPGEMLTKASHMLVQFYQLKLPTFLMESLYYNRCFAPLSYFINHCGSSISDSLRASIFRILHSLDDLRVASELRQRSGDKYTSAFPGHPDLRIDLLSLALPFLRGSSDPHTTSEPHIQSTEAEEALLLECLGGVPMHWLHNQESFIRFLQLLQVLSSIDEETDDDDTDIFTFCRSCLSSIISFIDSFHETYAAFLPNDAQERLEVQVELFEQLADLSRVIVAYNHSQSQKKVLELLEATLQQVATAGSTLFTGSPSKFLRILSLIPTAIESDTTLDVLLTKVLPNTFNVVLEHVSNYDDFDDTEVKGKGKEDHTERVSGREAILGKALDYASVAVSRPHHSERLLRETLEAICRVGDLCLPPKFYFAPVHDTPPKTEISDTVPISHSITNEAKGKGKAKQRKNEDEKDKLLDNLNIEIAKRNLRRKCDRIYLHLLELGLVFLRQSTEIDHINYLFNSSIPLAVQRILTWETDDIVKSKGSHCASPSESELKRSSDMLNILIRVLELSVATIEVGMNKMTLFHLYLPSAIDALRRLHHKNGFAFEECIDFGSYCFEQLVTFAKKRSNITLVLTHGIPTLGELRLPSINDFRSLWKHILHKFHVQSNFGLLLHLKDAYDFLMRSFAPEDTVGATHNRKRIRRLIARLISEGDREDVRALCFVCKPALLGVTFAPVHRLILAFGDDPITIARESESKPIIRINEESSKQRGDEAKGYEGDEMDLVRQYLQAQGKAADSSQERATSIEWLQPHEFSELLQITKMATVIIKEAPAPIVEENVVPQPGAGGAGEAPQNPEDAALNEERELARQQQREAERQARLEENRLIREGTVALVSHILRMMAQHWESISCDISAITSDCSGKRTWMKPFSDELSRVSLFKILYAQDLAEFARRRESHQHQMQQEGAGRDGKQDEEMADIFRIFRTKFPEDVAGQQAIMNVLTALSVRVETIRSQRPKFMHVADKAIACLNQLLQPLSEEEQMMAELQELNQEGQFELRRQRVERYVWSMQANVEERQRLIEAGYAEDLWDWNADLAVEVETEEAATWRLRLDQTYTNKLLACYREYAEILRDLDITSIQINDLAVSIESIFVEGLSLEDMKGRRSLVLQNIRHRLADLESQSREETEHRRAESTPSHNPSGSKRAAFVSRKHELLKKEEQIEKEWQRELQKGQGKQRKAGGKRAKKGKQVDDEHSCRKRYLVRLHTSYLSTLSTCGAQIAGCYAPNGVHAEKPIENGLKANVVMLSLYMEDTTLASSSSGKDEAGEKTDSLRRWGSEIESIEAILTDQGLYIYKSYASQHGEDTSLAWATFLRRLVESGFVPGVIIPSGHPDARTFLLISSAVPAHYTPTILTYRDNFFAESGVESYYDNKPDKIKVGDIFLTVENVHLLELPTGTIEENKQTGSSTLLRSSSELKAKKGSKSKAKKESQKDLVGTIVTNAMQALRIDNELQRAAVDPNIFGRHVGQYVNVFLDTLERKQSILSLGFDLNMWNARALKRKKGKAEAKIITEAEKELIMKRVAQIIDSEIEAAYRLDLASLLNENRVMFFELKAHLEKMIRMHPELPRDGIIASRVCSLRKQLQDHSEMVEIASLERSAQDQLIRWIFRNEDRVWRDRGGRPGEETLQQFQSLLAPNSSSCGRVFPGLVVFGKLRGGDQSDKERTKGLIKGLNDVSTECPVLAYSIGEFISPNSYEVITAWVDEGYRGMNLANQLYINTAYKLHELNRGINKDIQCRQVVCDILEGSMERIVSSSPLLSFLWWSGIGPRIVEKRHSSYVSETDVGTREHFERLVISLPILMLGCRIYGLYSATSSRLGYFTFTQTDTSGLHGVESVLAELDSIRQRGSENRSGATDHPLHASKPTPSQTWPRSHRPITSMYFALLFLALRR